jgi:hypothetical protein
VSLGAVSSPPAGNLNSGADGRADTAASSRRPARGISSLFGNLHPQGDSATLHAQQGSGLGKQGAASAAPPGWGSVKPVWGAAAAAAAAGSAALSGLGGGSGGESLFPSTPFGTPAHGPMGTPTHGPLAHSHSWSAARSQGYLGTATGGSSSLLGRGASETPLRQGSGDTAPPAAAGLRPANLNASRDGTTAAGTASEAAAGSRGSVGGAGPRAIIAPSGSGAAHKGEGSASLPGRQKGRLRTREDGRSASDGESGDESHGSSHSSGSRSHSSSGSEGDGEGTPIERRGRDEASARRLAGEFSAAGANGLSQQPQQQSAASQQPGGSSTPTSPRAPSPGSRLMRRRGSSFLPPALQAALGAGSLLPQRPGVRRGRRCGPRVPFPQSVCLFLCDMSSYLCCPPTTLSSCRGSAGDALSGFPPPAVSSSSPLGGDAPAPSGSPPQAANAGAGAVASPGKVLLGVAAEGVRQLRRMSSFGTSSASKSAAAAAAAAAGERTTSPRKGESGQPRNDNTSATGSADARAGAASDAGTGGNGSKDASAERKSGDGLSETGASPAEAPESLPFADERQALAARKTVVESRLVKEGWLVKQGHNFKTWRRRW